MPSNLFIKNTAKNHLHKNFTSAFAVGFLVIAIRALLTVFAGLIASLCSAFSEATANIVALVFFVAATLFLYIPVLLGAIRWFWFTTGGYTVPPAETLYYFYRTDEYFKAISLGFRLFLRGLLNALLCFAPALLITLFSQPTLYEAFGLQMPYWLASMWMFENMFFVVGALAFVAFMLRYLAAPILLINNNKLSTSEALYFSATILRPHKAGSFNLLISLVGWMLLNLLVFPQLYTVPYFLCIYIVYMRTAIEKYNAEASRFNAAFAPQNTPNPEA